MISEFMSFESFDGCGQQVFVFIGFFCIHAWEKIVGNDENQSLAVGLGEVIINI